LQEALTSYQHAVEMDGKFAPAYVGMADAYNVLGGYGFVPPGDAFPQGKEAARKALQLAPNLSDAYASLGFAAFYYDWDWKEADSLFRKAIALNPNNQVAHTFYTAFLHATGRLDEAEAQNRIAIELDPMSAWVYDDKGWLLLSRQRPEEAVVQFRKGVAMDRSYPAAHLSLAVALSRVGKFQEALEEVRQADALHGDPTRSMEVLGSVQALSGDRAGAEATLEKLKSGNFAGRVSPYSVALIYNSLGRKDEALDWLEKGVHERDTWCVWIKALVEWQNLKDEPRFQKLLAELKL
jgi:tetratricopeptide (TPR) repeat protein